MQGYPIVPLEDDRMGNVAVNRKRKPTGNILHALMDRFQIKNKWKNTHIILISLALVLWARSLSQIADRVLPNKMWVHLLIVGLVLVLFYGDDGQLTELHALNLETAVGVQGTDRTWEKE